MKDILDNILIRELVEPIIIILVSLLLYILLKNVVHNLFKVASKRVNNKKRETLKTFFLNIIRYLIIIIDILMILEVYGIDTKAIIASIGVLSVTLGLALQDMIKDFVGGISLVLDDTYNVGDWVTINNFMGEVLELGMKTTRIKAYNGDTLIINNGSITQVINHSMHNSMAIVDVSVSYNVNLDECEKVLTNFCKKLEKKLPTLKGEISLLGVESLKDSSVTFRISAEVEPTTQYEVQRIIRKLVRKELDKYSIPVSLPQVVVHHE